jgi:hypothetical protein
LWQETINFMFCLSVLIKNSAAAGRVDIKSDVWVCFENLLKNFVSLTCDTNNGYITWSSESIFDYISLISS